MDDNESDVVEKKIDDTCNRKKLHDEKSKLDNVAIEQELLGSVTTVNNPGLRTSARVIQKMKQDSIRPSTPPPVEKKDIGKDDKGLQRTPSQTKAPKVIWSNYEKNLFFDALNEFGKDFESIANFINSKIKRKSVADQSFKTKEQIRQIFYQTFHKLSKYLKFSDDVKKPAQELYALINYGEMRRKLAFVSEKNCMKMKDLVYKGHVTVRSKGKNIRIKTPPCKSLRKLNQLDDWQEDINLPAKVEVCLKPANMDAWGRVQSIAQNPLVRTTVPLQKKLINLIKTFQYKWRNEETKLIHHSFAMAKQNINASKQENKNTNESESSSYQEPLICLCPPSDVVIHKPLVSITEFLSSFSICLNSYEQKIGVKVRGETLCNKRQRSDSGCEKKSPDAKKLKIELEIKPLEISSDVVTAEKDEKEPKTDFSEVSNSNHSNPDECPDILISDENVLRFERQDSNDGDNVKKIEILSNGNDNASCSFAASTSVKSEALLSDVIPKISPEVKTRKKDVKCSANKKKEYRKDVTNLKPLLDEETERKMRKGWTTLNAGDISVGDLYITFGHDSKIILEYYWMKKDIEKVSKKEKSMMPYNASSVEEGFLNVIKSSHISNKLRHLLVIANLTERIKKKPCNCGHICEKGLKNKKGDNEVVTKSYVSNKTYTASHNDGIFRQPAAPFRRQMLPMENFRLMQNGVRYNHSRMLMKSRSLASKQVVVQRLLPVQPGINQSYDVVTPQVHVRTIIEKPTAQSKSWHDDLSKKNLNGNKESTENNGNDSLSDDDNDSDVTIENEIKEIIEITDSDSNERPFMDLKSETDDTVFAVSTPENCDNKEIDINEDPGIQELMEISLPSPAPVQCLDDSDTCSIPPMSPMRLIRDSPTDPKWLADNLSDFSLSSFLGHLDEMNRDLDSTNMSMISESSIDYMTKFAEIAASMQNEDKDL